MKSYNDDFYFTPFNFLDQESKKKIINSHPYYDKHIFFSDFEKCEKLYRKISYQLYQKLNVIHKVSYKDSYWDIILEQWLFRIIMMTKENWACVEILNQEIVKPKCTMYNLNYEDVVHENGYEFCVGLYNGGNSLFQNFVYLKILRYFNFKEIILEDYTLRKKKKLIPKTTYLLKIMKIISKIIIIFKKNFKIMSVFPQHLKTEIKSHFKFLIPYLFLNFQACKVESDNYDSRLRDWNIEIDYQNDYEKFICDLIPKILPKMVIEDYKKFTDLINKKYPIKVENILKSPTDNDFINFFVAKQKSMGSKIHMFQHGNNYGQLKICPDEKIELNHSDFFYTWGWNSNLRMKNTKCNIVPFYPVNLTYVNELNLNKEKKEISIILKCHEDYFYQFQSMENYIHQKKYNESILSFQNNLKDEVIKNVSIRLHPADKIYRYKKYLRSVKIHDGNENIFNFLKKVKLCVLTYNGTTYMNAFALNIPTIVFFSKNHTFFRETSEKYFDYLRDANIMFDDEKKAAEFINSIYPDVEKWWFDDKTQKNKKLFCDNFLNLDPSKKNKYDNLVKDLLKNEKNL